LLPIFLGLDFFNFTANFSFLNSGILHPTIFAQNEGFYNLISTFLVSGKNIAPKTKVTAAMITGYHSP